MVPIPEKSGPYLVPFRDFVLVGPDLATLLHPEYTTRFGLSLSFLGTHFLFNLNMKVQFTILPLVRMLEFCNGYRVL